MEVGETDYLPLLIQFLRKYFGLIRNRIKQKLTQTSLAICGKYGGLRIEAITLKK